MDVAWNEWPQTPLIFIIHLCHPWRDSERFGTFFTRVYTRAYKDIRPNGLKVISWTVFFWLIKISWLLGYQLDRGFINWVAKIGIYLLTQIAIMRPEKKPFRFSVNRNPALRDDIFVGLQSSNHCLQNRSSNIRSIYLRSSLRVKVSNACSRAPEGV